QRATAGEQLPPERAAQAPTIGATTDRPRKVGLGPPLPTRPDPAVQRATPERGSVPPPAGPGPAVHRATPERSSGPPPAGRGPEVQRAVQDPESPPPAP